MITALALALQQPQLVTTETRNDPRKLAKLEAPGQILMKDSFDSPDSLQKYFEVRGHKEGNAKIVSGALQLTSPDRQGGASGAGVSYWLGNEGYERVHLRYRLKFAEDYDQGNLNHTGAGLVALSTNGKWDAMGTAGLRPKGDDYCNMALETWVDWRRYSPPGYLFCYTYWKDMVRDKDGHFWGNMLGPGENDRIIPTCGKWITMELMMKLNTPGKADGEQATWVNGKLYSHYKGFEWRASEKVRIKRLGLDIYVHQARKENRVWFDDAVASTGFVGL